jgi:hypothetical protein
MCLIQHQRRPESRAYYFAETVLNAYKPNALSKIHRHSLACAEADIATNVATVKARITFIFIDFSWAQVARMQMLPLKMPDRYNF